MAKNENPELEKEFKEFLVVEPAPVPASVSESIMSHIQIELHPSAFKVFGKILLIQLAVGLVTLLLCPQFGVSLTSNRGIMPYLIKYGDAVCMLGCGSFFTALTLFIVSFVLKPEEVRSLRRREAFHLIGVSTLSLSAFICFGGEVVLTLGLIWLFGAVIGGAVTLEAGWALRQGLARGRSP